MNTANVAKSGIQRAAARKLFVGPRLRRLREQAGWSQGVLAERLGLSLSYVSQMETDQRPVTAAVLLKLAAVFGRDVAQFSEEQDRQLLAELDAALDDRTLAAAKLGPAQLARAMEQAPELVDAFLRLYRRHQQLQETHAQAIDRFYAEQPAAPSVPSADDRRAWTGGSPHEDVRDYFNRRANHIEPLDRLAESLAGALALRPGQRTAPLREALLKRCGVEVDLVEVADASGEDPTLLRQYDPRRRRLRLPSFLSDAQLAFQIATQYALLAAADVVAAEIAAAGFVDAPTQALARQGLAHYFAGAVLLPYGQFLQGARELRYDLERLQQRFHVSFETVCHRLSTLQRPDARGVPFYFVRVDQAGNISKRQSATAFHFARHGGACPLWNVHEAFAQPGRILVQVAEMPDGTRFFGLARTIERHGGGGWQAERKLFAVGLGCELAHARELVYADGLELGPAARPALIGPGCRVCPRERCVQRAFPPVGKALVAADDRESLVSYTFARD